MTSDKFISRVNAYPTEEGVVFKAVRPQNHEGVHVGLSDWRFKFEDDLIYEASTLYPSDYFPEDMKAVEFAGHIKRIYELHLETTMNMRQRRPM